MYPFGLVGGSRYQADRLNLAGLTPAQRSPESSPRREGTLCCTASDRPDDSADERAASAAAPEAEQHPSVEQSFRAQ